MRNGRSPSPIDVLVVGAGPAGLSAALVCARARRAVLVVDSGEPRNAAATGVRGFLTRDGIAPKELRRIGRQEVERYGGRIVTGEAISARAIDRGFEVRLASGAKLTARKLVLATGLRDRIPQIEGADRRYGVSVHHCPHCDGHEHAGEPLAVYARGAAGFALSRKLLAWSSDVALLTDGPTGLRAEKREELARLGIPVIATPIARLEGRGRSLARVRFADGSAIERSALFFSLGYEQRSPLAASLGCRFTRSGCVVTEARSTSGVRHLSVVGDASRDTQMVAVAVAEGAIAAVRIVEELIAEACEAGR